MQGRGFCDLQAIYEANEVRVFGVSFDTPEENRAFSEKFDFYYPLLSDSARTLAMAFGAAKTANDGYAGRVGVILNAEGVVTKHYAQASARTFPLDVLEDLGIPVELE